MLTAEENELITRVGPGTPMGEVLRRYWMPALLASDLPEPDCPPVAGEAPGRGAGRVPRHERPGRPAGRVLSAPRAPRCSSAATRSAACAACTTAGSSTWTATAWTCRTSRPTAASRTRSSILAYPDRRARRRRLGLHGPAGQTARAAGHGVAAGAGAAQRYVSRTHEYATTCRPSRAASTPRIRPSSTTTTSATPRASAPTRHRAAARSRAHRLRLPLRRHPRSSASRDYVRDVPVRDALPAVPLAAGRLDARRGSAAQCPCQGPHVGADGRREHDGLQLDVRVRCDEAAHARTSSGCDEKSAGRGSAEGETRRFAGRHAANDWLIDRETQRTQELHRHHRPEHAGPGGAGEHGADRAALARAPGQHRSGDHRRCAASCWTPSPRSPAEAILPGSTRTATPVSGPPTRSYRRASRGRRQAGSCCWRFSDWQLRRTLECRRVPAHRHSRRTSRWPASSSPPIGTNG